MPIQNDDQARQAAQVLRDNPTHPRAGELEAELRRYSTESRAASRPPSAQIQSGDVPADENPQFSDEYKAQLAAARERQGQAPGRYDSSWQDNISDKDRTQLRNLADLAQADPSQQQSVDAQMRAIYDKYDPNAQEKINPLEAVGGAADMAADLGTFVIDQAWRLPVGGYAGLFSIAKGHLWDNMVQGEGRSHRDIMNQAANTARGWTESDNAATLENQDLIEGMGVIAAPLQAYDEAAQFVGRRAGRLAEISGGGEETQIAASAMGYTAMMALPDILTLGRARGINARNVAGQQSRQQVRRNARDNVQKPQIGRDPRTGEADPGRALHGDLKFSPIAWMTRLRQRANSMRGGQQGRGMAMRESVDELKRQAGEAKDAMDLAWKDAELAGEMRYYTGNIEDWARTYKDGLIKAGDDLAIMPNVSRFLDDMQQVGKVNPLDRAERSITAQHGLPQSMADVRELEAMNRRLNQYIRSADSSEFAVLTRMKHDLNTTIDGHFERGLMSGDPDVRAAYLNAREASANYYSRFNDDQVISRMAHAEATPEEFRRWLLGASESLPPASINSVLDRIAELPNGGKMMDGIRLEVTRGLMEPLFKTKPNVDQFIEGVRTFIERNPSLTQRLDLDIGAIDELAAHARVMARHGGTGWLANLEASSMISRFAIGHGIARKAAEVNLMARTLRSVVGTVFGRSSRKMWNDYLDERLGTEFNLDTPMFNKADYGVLAAIHGTDLQREGISAAESYQATQEALQALPGQLREMADLNEATQLGANIQPGNVYNPGDDYNLLADAQRAVQSGGRAEPQSIAADLMIDENSPAITDFARYGKVHYVEGKGNATIGFGTEIDSISAESMKRMGWGETPDQQDAIRGRLKRGEMQINQEQAVQLMTHRLVENELKLRSDPVYRSMEPEQKRAIRNLAYNITGGPEKALNFGPRYRAALENGRMEEAAIELLRGSTASAPSDYFRQTKSRALRVAARLAGRDIDWVRSRAPRLGPT